MIDLFSKQATAIYGSVWEKIKKGEALSGDAEMIAETMIAHPEFDPFWLAGETAFQPQEINGFIVNPLVHIGLHVTIEQQLDADNPVEVRMALKGLLEKGITRHEAIHQIAGVWGDLYFRSVRRGGPFEDWTYLQELTRLSGEA
ncbi:MAG: DUF1841 family protein [Nitrospirae bacterium]|nr:DUF1841 family protein [Candidatus Troglogloeales bacterium]